MDDEVKRITEHGPNMVLTKKGWKAVDQSQLQNMVDSRQKLANKGKEIYNRSQLMKELDMVQPRMITHRRQNTFNYNEDELKGIKQRLATHKKERTTQNSSFFDQRKSLPGSTYESALSKPYKNTNNIQLEPIKSDWQVELGNRYTQIMERKAKSRLENVEEQYDIVQNQTVNNTPT